MRKSLSIPIFFIFFVLVLKFFIGIEKPHAATKDLPQNSFISLEVDDKPVIYKPSRVGINLGRWTSWGTQQFSSNILMNPGFEGQIDRVVVIVSQSDNKSFSGEAGWGYPDNYWDEAEFDIRSGASAGKRGVIRKSLNSGENGLPQYFSEELLPPIQENDVIVLTKLFRKSPVDHWWVNDDEIVEFDPYENRTNSRGSQSIRLTPTRISHAELQYYSDATAEKSGKMLKVQGPWKLSFWAKAESPGAELEVSFQRANGSSPFLKEVIYPTTDWQEYNLEFKGEDNGEPEHLKLSITAVRPNVSIWIDDISLLPQQQEDQTFRNEIIEALKIINPSYLREFAHLSDTWENRVAPPFERKSFVYRVTGGRQQAIYSYSLPDFLNLCSEVHANPWIIIPPTFSDFELRQLALFLAKYANKERFADVILEFGTDNWNWLKRPVGIPYHKEHGKVANRSFEIISKVVKFRSNVRFLVNGQYTSPENSLKFIGSTKLAEGLSITPYFLHSLDKATPDEDVLNMLFNQETKLMQTISDELFTRGKVLAVSEINLHTTEGTAKSYERNRVVAGAASGGALAKKILESMYAGADPILVNGLGQFDTKTWDIDDYVNLWGVTRNFDQPPLFRPTGLAIIMLNHVIGGNMYTITPLNDHDSGIESLTMAAFNTSKGWTAAIISKHDKPLNLEIKFSNDNLPLPKTILTLESDHPFQTNEFEETVKIAKSEADSEDRVIRITVPAWGFIALTQ